MTKQEWDVAIIVSVICLCLLGSCVAENWRAVEAKREATKQMQFNSTNRLEQSK